MFNHASGRRNCLQRILHNRNCAPCDACAPVCWQTTKKLTGILCCIQALCLQLSVKVLVFCLSHLSIFCTIICFTSHLLHPLSPPPQNSTSSPPDWPYLMFHFISCNVTLLSTQTKQYVIINIQNCRLFMIVPLCCSWDNPNMLGQQCK